MSAWSIIPIPARILAAVLLLAPAVAMSWFFGPAPEALFGFFIGGLLAATVLLAGYVYGDAPRRGMPPIPWTALTILAPNGIGFILYFVLRKPILHPCPACQGGVPVDAAFCPRCGAPQTPSAPYPTGQINVG